MAKQSENQTVATYHIYNKINVCRFINKIPVGNKGSEIEYVRSDAVH